MLLEFQLALGLLFLVLFICALFVLMVWRAQQDLHEKDETIQYQIQLFDIFTTYLSGNTDDVYMIIDNETNELDHISPNVTRVLGMDPKNVLEKMQAQDMETDPEAAMDYYKEIRALAPGKSAVSRYTERVNIITGEHRYFWENAFCVPIQGTLKRVCCVSDRTRERKTQNDLAEVIEEINTIIRPQAGAKDQNFDIFVSHLNYEICWETRCVSTRF